MLSTPEKINTNTCFESALFLSAPQVPLNQHIYRPTAKDNATEDFEGLIDKDLLQEINKCCTRTKALKDITKKELNSDTASSESDSNSKKGFSFPDGGWVCSLCKNYNFCGRMQCNRCNKKKTKEDFIGKPHHLLRFDGQNKDGKKKKRLNVRQGDWNCPFCDNINFAFRVECNKCGKGKDEAFESKDEE